MEKRKLVNTSKMFRQLADSTVLEFVKDYRVNENELTVTLTNVSSAIILAEEFLTLGYKTHREMFFVRVKIKD